MNRRLRNFFITVAAIYFVLLYYSPQTANFALAVFAVLMVPVLILRHIFLDKLYQSSIKIVPKRFVIGNNAINNEHCTVMYTPDEKIVVMDNNADKTHAKRMFTINKGKVNINRAWNRLCRVFDGFITLDSLASFFSYDTKIDIITLEAKVKHIEHKQVDIDVSKLGPSFVAMDEIQPDSYSKGTEKPREVKENFIDINKMKEQEPVKPREEKSPEFVEMGEILSKSTNKIDVNTAAASELSILPGINIVLAKKIVEYRDKNGLFKDIDDFIKAAEVKEHFVSKIKNMIEVGKPSEDKPDDDNYEGRVVDF